MTFEVIIVGGLVLAAIVIAITMQINENDRQKKLTKEEKADEWNDEQW